jgi:ABC-2 type transport system ATP-binding protein
LTGNPELLFLDEPTTGFDPAARRDAWGLIKGMAEAGTTVLLTTHYLEEAQVLADRVVVIRSGQVVADGPPDTLGNRMTAAATIRFRLSDPSHAAKLGVVPGGDWSVTFMSEAPTRDLNRLTGAALDAGIELDGLQVLRPSLEDAYLELIGHHETETTS